MFGEPLYRSREEKAANLLYFIVKDHTPSPMATSASALSCSSSTFNRRVCHNGLIPVHFDSPHPAAGRKRTGRQGSDDWPDRQFAGGDALMLAVSPATIQGWYYGLHV